MRVISRLVVAPKQQVLLLQVGKRVLVVGDCGTQMSELSEITDPDEISSLVGQIEQDKGSSQAGAFGALFGRAQKPFETSADEKPPATSLPAPAQTDSTSNGEIAGLMEKVRLLSSQFRRGAS